MAFQGSSLMVLATCPVGQVRKYFLVLTRFILVRILVENWGLKHDKGKIYCYSRTLCRIEKNQVKYQTNPKIEICNQSNGIYMKFLGDKVGKVFIVLTKFYFVWDMRLSITLSPVLVSGRVWKRVVNTATKIAVSNPIHMVTS